MPSLADRLAEVNRRIADAEQRIVAHRHALECASAMEAPTLQVMLDLATNTLRELRVHRTRLQSLIVVKDGEDRT